MRRETAVAALRLVGSLRGHVEETRRLVDEEALQVGDRNLIDQTLTTIAGEIEVLARAFADMLADGSRIEN